MDKANKLMRLVRPMTNDAKKADGVDKANAKKAD
jgi:hypothetical protein